LNVYNKAWYSSKGSIYIVVAVVVSDKYFRKITQAIIWRIREGEVGKMKSKITCKFKQELIKPELW
jgi:hypothetical protein